jgi:purine-binding chemotaxis protein CheW
MEEKNLQEMMDQEANTSSQEMGLNHGDDVKEFLTFKVENEEFGVEITSIKEIKGWTEATRLPNVAAYILGVVNLRGAIIPVFDLKARFGMGRLESDKNSVVIFLSSGSKLCGILVESVSDILKVKHDEVQPPPSVAEGLRDEFVSGLLARSERMVVLLDVDRLFRDSAIKSTLDQQANDSVKQTATKVNVEKVEEGDKLGKVETDE